MGFGATYTRGFTVALHFNFCEDEQPVIKKLTECKCVYIFPQNNSAIKGLNFELPWQHFVE